MASDAQLTPMMAQYRRIKSEIPAEEYLVPIGQAAVARPGTHLSVITYGIGTVLGIALLGALVILIIHDVTQKKHTVLRNYPVIGHLRFLFEFSRAAGLMEGQDRQEGGPKLLSGQGVSVVQPRHVGPPTLGDGADGQVLLKAQPQQLDAPGRLGAALVRASSL